LRQIFLIRHGITKQNKNGCFQGITDNPLSETGIKQAIQIKKFLIDKNIEFIYSSPLTRAYETAKPLATALDLEIIKESKIKEINCGDWEGLSVETIRKKSDRFKNWITKGTTTAPNGESIENVMERISPFVNKLLKQSDKTGKNIAVFAHGAVNRAFICKILCLTPEKAFRFEQANGCINCFSVREDFPVTFNLLNFTQHLAELENE
jgi:broad specificity phosphatase PhoE